MINFENNELNDVYFIFGVGSIFLDYEKYVRIFNILIFWNGF